MFDERRARSGAYGFNMLFREGVIDIGILYARLPVTFPYCIETA